MFCTTRDKEYLSNNDLPSRQNSLELNKSRLLFIESYEYKSHVWGTYWIPKLANIIKLSYMKDIDECIFESNNKIYWKIFYSAFVEWIAETCDESVMNFTSIIQQFQSQTNCPDDSFLKITIQYVFYQDPERNPACLFRDKFLDSIKS